jgi:hypothetical protein
MDTRSGYYDMARPMRCLRNKYGHRAMRVYETSTAIEPLMVFCSQADAGKWLAASCANREKNGPSSSSRRRKPGNKEGLSVFRLLLYFKAIDMDSVAGNFAHAFIGGKRFRFWVPPQRQVMHDRLFVNG